LVSALAGIISDTAVNAWGCGAVAAIFFVGALLLFVLGILGEYLGRVYDEVRGRPLSIIHKVHYAELDAMRDTTESADLVVERLRAA